MMATNKDADLGVNLSTWHVPPPVLAGIAFGIQTLLSRRHATTSRSRAAGGFIAGGAALLVGGAVAQFRRSRTTINPKTLDTTKLMVTGPNRWTRNPMYLGTTALLVSYAVARRSWLALMPALTYAVLIDRLQIPAEEAELQHRFGVDFERYCAVTPRWLGWPARRR